MEHAKAMVYALLVVLIILCIRFVVPVLTCHPTNHDGSAESFLHHAEIKTMRGTPKFTRLRAQAGASGGRVFMIPPLSDDTLLDSVMVEDGPPMIGFSVNLVPFAQFKRGSIAGKVSTYPINLLMSDPSIPFGQRFITVKGAPAIIGMLTTRLAPAAV